MADALAALQAEVAVVIDDAIAGHPQADLFAGLGARLTTEGRVAICHAQTQPVVDQWLSAAVENAAGHRWRKLARLIEEATPAIPWVRAYENLESSPERDAFCDHYSYHAFAGPQVRGFEPAVSMENALIGFTLQAPDILYPAHHHAPPEIYGVIGGTLDWMIGDTWTTVGPGDVIVHRPHESHAMRTGAEPALTWVAWPSDPDTNVYMPSLDPPTETMHPTVY